MEFTKSDADFSVYVAQVEDVKFFIVVYVDDLILVCNNKDKLLQVKDLLPRKFEMKDLGDLHFFVGMEVERDRAQRLLYINQIGYLKEILNAMCVVSLRTFTFRRYKFLSLRASAITTPRALLTLQPSLWNSILKPSEMSLLTEMRQFLIFGT
jgi:hypothetical protein